MGRGMTTVAEGTWWQQIAGALRQDFSDLPDIGHVTQMVVRLSIAAILGGLLGYERERAGKAAGLRTHMLVAIGAALYVLIPQPAGATGGDMTRGARGGWRGGGVADPHAGRDRGGALRPHPPAGRGDRGRHDARAAGPGHGGR